MDCCANTEMLKYEGSRSIDTVFDVLVSETAEYEIDMASCLQAYKMLMRG